MDPFVVVTDLEVRTRTRWQVVGSLGELLDISSYLTSWYIEIMRELFDPDAALPSCARDQVEDPLSLYTCGTHLFALTGVALLLRLRVVGVRSRVRLVRGSLAHPLVRGSSGGSWRSAGARTPGPRSRRPPPRGGYRTGSAQPRGRVGRGT